MKVVSSPLRTESRKILDLQISRFLEVVVISHDVRIFLTVGTKSEQREG
jgi:hypothetical protein